MSGKLLRYFGCSAIPWPRAQSIYLQHLLRARFALFIEKASRQIGAKPFPLIDLIMELSLLNCLEEARPCRVKRRALDGQVRRAALSAVGCPEKCRTTGIRSALPQAVGSAAANARRTAGRTGSTGATCIESRGWRSGTKVSLAQSFAPWWRRVPAWNLIGA